MARCRTCNGIMKLSWIRRGDPNSQCCVCEARVIARFFGLYVVIHGDVLVKCKDGMTAWGLTRKIDGIMVSPGGSLHMLWDDADLF